MRAAARTSSAPPQPHQHHPQQHQQQYQQQRMHPSSLSASGSGGGFYGGGAGAAAGGPGPNSDGYGSGGSGGNHGSAMVASANGYRHNTPQQQQFQPAAPAAAAVRQHPAGASSDSGGGGDPASSAKDARDQWKQFGTTLTQAFEDQRSGVGVGVGGGAGRGGGIQARIVSAETRVDAAGSSYTAYVVRVVSPAPSAGGGGVVESWIERRYSDFDKLNATMRDERRNVQGGHSGGQQAQQAQALLRNVEASFPSKHWAGRLGPWTPSKLVAPTQHLKLIDYRCRQLDIWLVHVLQAYNESSSSQQLLSEDARHDVEKFLFATPEQMTPSSSSSSSRGNGAGSSSSMGWWKYVNPVSFSLNSALKQSERTLKSMTDCEDDRSIPLDLLQAAKGLAFMTVAKGGCVVSGRVGTGLVLARLDGGGGGGGACRWSAPCALGTVGVGWGAQIGGDVTHYLIVLTTTEAVRDLVSRNKSVQLGAELGVALGPVGRSAQSHVAAGDWTLHPAYSYAHSKGLFAGVSLEGSVVAVRDDVNAKFYGGRADAPDLLCRPGPPAAESLYRALDVAMRVSIPEGSWRPYSQIFLQPNLQQQQSSHPPPSYVSSNGYPVAHQSAQYQHQHQQQQQQQQYT